MWTSLGIIMTPTRAPTESFTILPSTLTPNAFLKIPQLDFCLNHCSDIVLIQMTRKAWAKCSKRVLTFSDYTLTLLFVVPSLFPYTFPGAPNAALFFFLQIFHWSSIVLFLFCFVFSWTPLLSLNAGSFPLLCPNSTYFHQLSWPYPCARLL